MASRHSRGDWRAVAVLLAAGVLVAGCGSGAAPGPSRFAVKGTVTLDGQPLQNAVIRFVPLDGVQGPKCSVAIREGMYEIPAGAGPVAGSHRVEIDSTDHGGIAPDDETALAQLTAGQKKLQKPLRIPAIYNTRSTLRQTIHAGSANEFDFRLVTRR